MGRTVMPGLSMSISTKEMPSCLRVPTDVRTSANIRLATCALPVQVLVPLITYSSPSRTARVFRDARSEPASGSE
jgi:hypothetical protein